jgi:integrase
VSSLSEVEQRKVRLDRYLDEWSEVVGLAWPDVDFDAGTISIRQTIQVDGRSLYVKGPKSRNSCRTIGLGPDTSRQLRRHRMRMSEDRLAAGASYQLESLDH